MLVHGPPSAAGSNTMPEQVMSLDKSAVCSSKVVREDVLDDVTPIRLNGDDGDDADGATVIQYFKSARKSVILNR